MAHRAIQRTMTGERAQAKPAMCEFSPTWRTLLVPHNTLSCAYPYSANGPGSFCHTRDASEQAVLGRVVTRGSQSSGHPGCPPPAARQCQPYKAAVDPWLLLPPVVFLPLPPSLPFSLLISKCQECTGTCDPKRKEAAGGWSQWQSPCLYARGPGSIPKCEIEKEKNKKEKCTWESRSCARASAQSLGRHRASE